MFLKLEFIKWSCNPFFQHSSSLIHLEDFKSWIFVIQMSESSSNTSILKKRRKEIRMFCFLSIAVISFSIPLVVNSWEHYAWSAWIKDTSTPQIKVSGCKIGHVQSCLEAKDSHQLSRKTTGHFNTSNQGKWLQNRTCSVLFGSWGFTSAFT